MANLHIGSGIDRSGCFDGDHHGICIVTALRIGKRICQYHVSGDRGNGKCSSGGHTGSAPGSSCRRKPGERNGPASYTCCEVWTCIYHREWHHKHGHLVGITATFDIHGGHVVEGSRCRCGGRALRKGIGNRTAAPGIQGNRTIGADSTSTEVYRLALANGLVKAGIRYRPWADQHSHLVRRGTTTCCNRKREQVGAFGRGRKYTRRSDQRRSAPGSATGKGDGWTIHTNVEIWTCVGRTLCIYNSIKCQRQKKENTGKQKPPV